MNRMTLVAAMVAAGSMSGCAPTPSPIASIEYEAIFTNCLSHTTARAAVDCMNQRQLPLFAGNEDVLERLVVPRIQIADAIDSGRMDLRTGLESIIRMDIAAHQEITGKVLQYNQNMANLAVGLNQYNQQIQQQQMHQQTLDALNRPTNCTSTPSYGRINTTCW